MQIWPCKFTRVNFGAVTALFAPRSCVSQGVHRVRHRHSRRRRDIVPLRDIAEQERAYLQGLESALDAGYRAAGARWHQPRRRDRRGCLARGQPAVQRGPRRGAHARWPGGTRRIHHGWRHAGGRRGRRAAARPQPDRARAPRHGEIAARHAGGRRRRGIRARPGRGAGVERILPYAHPTEAAAPPAAGRGREGERPGCAFLARHGHRGRRGARCARQRGRRHLHRRHDGQAMGARGRLADHRRGHLCVQCRLRGLGHGPRRVLHPHGGGARHLRADAVREAAAGRVGAEHAGAHEGAGWQWRRGGHRSRWRAGAWISTARGCSAARAARRAGARYLSTAERQLPEASRKLSAVRIGRTVVDAGSARCCDWSITT